MPYNTVLTEICFGIDSSQFNFDNEEKKDELISAYYEIFSIYLDRREMEEKINALLKVVERLASHYPEEPIRVETFFNEFIEYYDSVGKKIIEESSQNNKIHKDAEETMAEFFIEDMMIKKMIYENCPR